MARTIRNFLISVAVYWPLVTVMLWGVGMFFFGTYYALIPSDRTEGQVYMGDLTRLASIIVTVFCVCIDPVEVRDHLRRRLP
jgi:D-alanyl-lipoteichoic acid acyltransferase DltB (MBOAT superfamily)